MWWLWWSIYIFCKGSKQFNSTHNSDKCLILGTHIKGSNCYLETSFTKWTDIDFRNKTYALHPNYDIPLSKLLIDMITTFIIDYMHYVLLTIIKKWYIFIYLRIKL